MPVRDLLFSASGASAPSDPNFENVSLLLSGDGTNGAQNNTFLDSSTNNFTITRNGNTTQGSFSPYGTLWSNYFVRASSQYLTVPNPSSQFSFGTGAFTIECWVNLTTMPSGTGYPASYWMFGGGLFNSDVGVDFYINNTQIGFNLTAFSSPTVIGNHGMSVGQWYHVAVVRGGASNQTMSIYVNGSRVANATSVIATADPAITGIAISAAEPSGATSGNFNGYISNYRVVKGTAVYDPTQTTLTVPTTPLTAITNTSLLTCQSNRFIDNSTNNFTLTVNGTPSVQRFSPFNPTAPYSTSVIGGSGYFDGSGDSLTVPQNSAFNFGTGAFTVESWVYITKFTSQTENRIIGLGLGANPGIFTGWSLIIFKNSNELSWYRYDGTVYSLTGSATFTTGQWYHIVAVRNGSSNLSMYVNGTRIYNNTSATLSYNNVNSDPVYFATETTGAGALDVGCYLTDTKVVSGTAVYDPTQTTITIPASPISATTNTQLLTNFTNAGIPDLAMQNNLETVGNAQVSTSVKKYGTGSLAFDGTGDSLKAPSNPAYAFGTGAYTVEFWIYWNALGSQETISTTNNFSSGCWTFYDGGSVVSVVSTGGSGSMDYTWTGRSTGTWYHVAISRESNSTQRLFINGTQVVSGTYTNNFGQNGLQIGDGFGADFNGYIDDLRITKGLARYTANFTPPTAALPTF